MNGSSRKAGAFLREPTINCTIGDVGHEVSRYFGAPASF